MKRILLGLSLFISANLFAQDEIYVKDSAAINGYDVVAYFKEGKPVKGSNDFTVIYKNVKWLFANRSNAETFKAAPEKYEPQYGGYCAYGCSQGHKAKTDPDAWTIVNGKLYLNYSLKVKDMWNKDQQGYIKKADTNWIDIKSQKYN